MSQSMFNWQEGWGSNRVNSFILFDFIFRKMREAINERNSTLVFFMTFLSTKLIIS